MGALELAREATAEQANFHDTADRPAEKSARAQIALRIDCQRIASKPLVRRAKARTSYQPGATPQAIPQTKPKR